MSLAIYDVIKRREQERCRGGGGRWGGSWTQRDYHLIDYYLLLSLNFIYYPRYYFIFSHISSLKKKSMYYSVRGNIWDISFECQILWTSAANSWNTKQHNLKPTTMFIKYCRLGLSHILCEKVMLPQEGKDLTFSKIKSQYQLEHIHLIRKLKCDLRFN